jgi:hypothetical protein
MINDVSILRLKPRDQNRDYIPRMDPIDESDYNEFWSFWGVEKAYQEIDGRKRLRYHLGHVLFGQQLRDLNNRGNDVKRVLLNYKGAGETQGDWKKADLDTTERFLKILIGDTVTPELITDWVDTVRHSRSMKPFYDKIKSQTYELTEPIRVAYENFKKNEHTLYYLEKYRDLSVGDLQYVPPALNDFYKTSGIDDIVPSHVFFASMFALHRSARSDSDFVNGFWVQEGFPLLACIKEVEDRKICIIEGKRSAYIWLFIDYLRIMYDHKNNCKLNLPDVGYLDSLPSLHGAPFMQLDVPSEALFIDSSSEKMKEKMSHMSEVVRMEYSLRVLDMPYAQKQWIDGAVSACEKQRTLITELLAKHKRTNKQVETPMKTLRHQEARHKETYRALIDFGKEINTPFRAWMNLVDKLREIYANKR